MAMLDIEYKWRTHSGHILPIKDMPDDHLQNAIKMIKRGYDASGRSVRQDVNETLPFLIQEAIKRGLIPAEDGWDK